MKEKLQKLIQYYPGRFEISEGEKWYLKETIKLGSTIVSEATLCSHVSAVLKKVAKEVNITATSLDTDETLIDKILEYHGKSK